MDADQIKERQARRRANAPELSKQLRQRRANKADGDIHAVDHGVHQSRVQEAAARTQVARPPQRRYQKASALPAMPELPGFQLRWIRRDNQTRGDNQNLIARLQEGWEFARKEDFPEQFLPTQNLSDHGLVVGNGSSILMKIHEDLIADRDSQLKRKRDLITKAVNDPRPKLDVAHPSLPLVENLNRHEAGFIKSRARKQVGVAND